MEQWKPIPNYEGLYEVSDLGRVRNATTHRLIYQRKPREGYVQVQLHKQGGRRYFFVHRLVALAFLPNPENKPQVDHLNGIRDDNRLTNLKWCTTTENAESPLTKMFRGDIVRHRHHGVVQFDTDGTFIKVWKSAKAAADGVGVFRTTIVKACNGDSKTAGGYLWRYADRLHPLVKETYHTAFAKPMGGQLSIQF